MTAVQPQVVCLGEAMVMVAPVDPAPLRDADLFQLHVGGAESTVALYLHELGHRAAWVSRVGDDALGQRIVNALDRHGLDTSWVVVDPSAPTGVYFKDPGEIATQVLYYRRGSAASRMGPDDLARLPLETAAVVHLSGITAGLSSSCHDLVRAAADRLARCSALLSFDVNYRPGLWSVCDAAPVLLDLAARADVVYVGQDEAQTLWGTSTADEVRRLLPDVTHLVVKDGAVGATEHHGVPSGTPSGDVVTFAPAPRLRVVEAVGAGDAFAAGHLSGLLTGLDSRERLESGHRLAARALASTRDYVPAGG